MNDFRGQSQEQALSKILNNKKVVDFVKRKTFDSYELFFTGYKKEIHDMLEETFQLLDKIHKHLNNKNKIIEIVTHIDNTIFRKTDPTFWFNQLYLGYKINYRPEADFLIIRNYIQGQRVLDFGSGKGYLSLKLLEKGYEVLATDVMDYRLYAVKQIPYKKMKSPYKIPYRDNSVDTVIAKTVLHHIDAENIPKIIREFARVGKRVILEEDTYDLPLTMSGINKLREKQPYLSEFMAMSPKDQLESIILSCYFANSVAHGVPGMNFPFEYKSVDEWKRIFGENGFVHRKTIVTGFPLDKITRNCQVWMVFDRKD